MLEDHRAQSSSRFPSSSLNFYNSFGPRMTSHDQNSPPSSYTQHLERQIVTLPPISTFDLHVPTRSSAHTFASQSTQPQHRQNSCLPPYDSTDEALPRNALPPSTSFVHRRNSPFLQPLSPIPAQGGSQPSTMAGPSVRRHQSVGDLHWSRQRGKDIGRWW